MVLARVEDPTTILTMEFIGMSGLAVVVRDKAVPFIN